MDRLARLQHSGTQHISVTFKLNATDYAANHSATATLSSGATNSLYLVQWRNTIVPGLLTCILNSATKAEGIA